VLNPAIFWQDFQNHKLLPKEPMKFFEKRGLGRKTFVHKSLSPQDLFGSGVAPFCMDRVPDKNAWRPNGQWTLLSCYL